MSLDAFISGQSVVTPFGDHVPTATNPIVRRHRAFDERSMLDGPLDASPEVSSSISVVEQDYADDDDEEEECANDAPSTKLAERASDILGTYREYVSSKHDDEEMMLGRRRSNISPTRRKPIIGDGITDDDDSTFNGRKYHYARHLGGGINHEKLRRFATFCGIVFTVAILAIVASSINDKMRGNNGSPSSLLEERKKMEDISMLLEQEEEDRTMGGKDDNFGANNEGYDLDGSKIHDENNDGLDATMEEGRNGKDGEKDESYAIIEEGDITVENVNANTNTVQEVEEDFDATDGLVKETFVPIVKPGQEYYIESDGEREGDSPSSSQVQSTVDSTIPLLREQFKPLWLSSAEGWNGGSYSDAASFCNSIRGKELCPYSVICPHGPGHAVMGGLREVEFVVDGEQYAPIAGGENHWVMVGDARNANDDGTQDEDAGMSTKCMTHRQLEGKNPDWGLNGDRSDIKKYIMCCTVN
ncbi:hypothetical protein ACHAXA_004725 [Cyclostephanos tholiformis]|uniref:DUF7495 domain-containing protein n=1 Tax=Cyclostephanos tholiformis TaxID=382380 RepID=A0ABD3SS48_9STRA